LGYLYSLKEFILLVSVIFEIYPRCSCCTLGDLRIHYG